MNDTMQFNIKTEFKKLKTIYIVKKHCIDKIAYT